MLKIKDGILFQCCICGRFQQSNDKWIEFEKLCDNAISIIIQSRIGLCRNSISHGYCPVCVQVVHEEIARYKEEKKKGNWG